VTTSGLFEDPADPIIALLADQIADRLAQRLGPRLADIIDPGDPNTVAGAAASRRSGDEQRGTGSTEAVGGEGLWTARRVATHYAVAQSFVYQHADELGCVRLGGGKCPRLRFDPQVVRERWPRVGESLPAVSAQRTRSDARTRRARRAKQRGYELLDFDPEP
jgi:hypothetical protein